MESKTEMIIKSSDAAAWPGWVNVGVPIVAIIMFIITVIVTSLHKPKHAQVQMKLPVIVTKVGS